MPEFKTKEEYGAWKVQRLKGAKENRKDPSQAPVESAAKMMRLQTRMIFSDALSLLILGVLAAVFVFSVLSSVLHGLWK
jgi:hypothetical protein